MKRVIIIASIFMAACSKTEHPVVTNDHFYYKNLGDYTVDYDNGLLLDMNNDGTTDCAFATTMKQNPIDNSVEKLEFKTHTYNGSELFLDQLSPRAFSDKETISTTDGAVYKWKRNNALVVTRLYTNNPAVSYWEGAWKDKTDKYLGVKVKASDKYYTGWIRLSIGGEQSKIIVHDYALSKTADIDIKAGDR